MCSGAQRTNSAHLHRPQRGRIHVGYLPQLRLVPWVHDHGSLTSRFFGTLLARRAGAPITLRSVRVLKAVKFRGIVDENFADGGVVAGARDQLIEQRSSVEPAIDGRRGLGAWRMAVAADVWPVGPPDATVGIGLDERADDR